MAVARRFVLVTALLVACAGKSEDSPASGGDHGGSSSAGAGSLSACEPLDPVTSTVQLEAPKVVAAGRAADGTFYVVYDSDRLFVGNAEGLVERVVLGSGKSSTQTDLDYADDDGTPVKVELVDDGTTTQMLVARGAQSGKGVDPGGGEALTLVDAATVARLTTSTTATFTIDFAASLADGRALVVVAPAHDVDYSQFRVFFGPPSALAERPVSNFGSSRSGQRFATVTIDGAAAELTYLAGGPSVLNPNGGPTTLTLAGAVYDLEEAPAPANAAYLCFSN